MKIIEQIWFNLKQIRFKETKAYLDSLTDKYGWSYKNMAFSFCTGSTEKAFKMFPMLKKYDRSLPYRSVISSMGDNTLFVDKNDENELCRIITKVPNPINFGFINVYLDNIDWYGESKESVPAHFFEGIPYELYGNNIRMRKEFDYGNKFNPVCITIDRTSEAGELREYPIGFAEFINELGKPYNKELSCIFPPEDHTLFSERKELIKKHFNGKYCIDSTGLVAASDNEYMKSRVEPISGFSPKTIISKEAQKHKYVATKHRQVLRYTKINEHNHAFYIDIVRPPLTSVTFAEITFKGYNFEITISICDTDIYLSSEEKAEIFAKRVFNMADNVISLAKPMLYEAFGDTPKWYIESI